MNIFTIMERVSRRTEPYHAHLMAEALRVSQAGDRKLFDGFWRLAAPESWEIPDSIAIHDEDVLVDGRIDIVFAGHDSRILGIEVKTAEASCQDGQLGRYAVGLREKYPGRDHAIAYLTPFNRARAGSAGGRLPSVRHYEAFRERFKQCRHLSWVDVSGIDWPGGGELWAQHRQYVESVVCAPQLLNRVVGGGRDFAHFFGQEPAEVFSEAIAIVAATDGYDVDTRSVSDPQRFASAFRVLIDSPMTDSGKTRRNRFPQERMNELLASSSGGVHKALFALADEYPHVWVEGKSDYGLRVAHRNHSSGVSIVRSKGSMQLSIGRPR